MTTKLHKAKHQDWSDAPAQKTSKSCVQCGQAIWSDESYQWTDRGWTHQRACGESPATPRDDGLIAPAANKLIVCDGCGTPAAELQVVLGQWRLILKARHHGQVHVTQLTQFSIYDLVNQMKE